MLQEEEEGVLRFYAFLTPPDTEENHRKFITIDEADLVDGVDVKIPQLDAVTPDGERLSFYFPLLPGYCQVGGTLFIVGGMHIEDKCGDSNLLLSFDPAAPSPRGDCSTATGLSSWEVAGVMCTGRQRCVAIPYDGKIFVFGGVLGPNTVPEIYDPQSGKFSPPMDFPEDLGLEYPTSYFLWKDSRNPHKKPLIVLYSDYPGEPSRLYSYDVEGNCWELFDRNFPAPPRNFGHWRRNLIPLGCSDTLLLIDYAAHWSVYNLSSKEVVGEVKVPDLNNDQQVTHAFRRLSSNEGSLIFYFYIFMDETKEKYEVCSTRVPYAVVKLRIEGEEFVATVESKGALEVAEYVDICMFAEQIGKPKRTLEEAPFEGGEHSKKMKL